MNMKRLLALMLILCMLPIVSLAASNPTLPDFKSYSKQQLELIETAEKDYLIMEKFSGSQSQISALVDAYVELLIANYGMHEVAGFQVDYGTYKRVNHALIYTDFTSMGTFNIYNDDYHWHSDCQVFLQYNLVESGNSTMWLYYRPEFDYRDTGDRYGSTSSGTTGGTA